SRRRHTRSKRDWSSDVCSSDLFRQDRNVVQALAQGRDPDGKDVQPIEEVLTKPTTLDSGLEIAVGGGDDTHIDGNRMTAPQPFRSEERRVGKQRVARCASCRVE